MAYYRSEENVYCDSIKTTVNAGQTEENLSIAANGPCCISGIIAKFSASTSGDFIVNLTRNDVTVELLKVTLEDNQSIVVSDINVWIPNAGSPNYLDSKLSVTNETQANADVIIDYAY